MSSWLVFRHSPWRRILDSERLWAESSGRYLLRDLTECKPWKNVNWRTANKDFEREGIPKSFRTSSRVCLIMNRFAFGDALEYDAIVDRAQFLYFDPTPLEIHKNTALWFWDQEVFDFIGEHLHIINSSKLSSRTYVKAYERKPKGDWKEFIACGRLPFCPPDAACRSWRPISAAFTRSVPRSGALPNSPTVRR